MNFKEHLKLLGLSNNTVQVYLALLELKKATVLELTQKSGVARSNVYNKIQELKNLGLVSEAIEGKKKYLVAEAPKNLINLIKEKEKLAKQVIPFLTQEFEKDKYKPKIKFYEGLAGIKKLHEETLNNQEKIMRSIGDYQIFRTCLSLRYSRNYWQKRVRQKIQVKLIDSKGNLNVYRHNKEFSEISNIKRLREVRLVPKGFNFKLFIMTFDDKVLFFAPPEEGYSFIFESPSFAETVKNWFDLLWEVADPLFPKPTN